MRLIVIILLVVNVWPTWGQTFNRRYDIQSQNRAQTAWGIERITDSTYTVIQASSDIDTMAPGIVLTHYSIGLTTVLVSNGNVVREKRFYPNFKSVAPGWANCCDTIPDGGIVVCGSLLDTNQRLSPLLMLFDNLSDTLLTKDLGVLGQDWNNFSVKHTQDGGYICVGQTDATGYLDGFAIKTDALGNVEWRRTYGEPAPTWDTFQSVVQLADGDYILGGATFPTNTSQKRWVCRIDLDGDFVWDIYWPTTFVGANAQLTLLENEDILMASNWSYAPANQQTRFHLARMSSIDGSVIWERQYAAPNDRQVLFEAKEISNGDLIACGVTSEVGGYQGVLLRTTSTGDSLWMLKYFYQDSIIDDGVGQFYDVLPTPDGGFIATGPVYSRLNAPNPPGYSQDTWVVKVDGQGCIVPGCNNVGITEQATNLQDALTLFPNPVATGQALNLQLDLPPSVANQPLQLTVVSTDGRVVHQQNLAGNGAHTLALQPTAAGVYYVHVAAESKWLTGGKFVVE